MKKLTRLPITLELDIKESSYMRFMKKFKMPKEKSTKNISQTMQNSSNLSGVLGVSDSKTVSSLGKINSQLISCTYHREIECYILQKFNTNLVPL